MYATSVIWYIGSRASEMCYYNQRRMSSVLFLFCIRSFSFSLSFPYLVLFKDVSWNEVRQRKSQALLAWKVPSFNELSYLSDHSNGILLEREATGGLCRKFSHHKCGGAAERTTVICSCWKSSISWRTVLVRLWILQWKAKSWKQLTAVVAAGAQTLC